MTKLFSILFISLTVMSSIVMMISGCKHNKPANPTKESYSQQGLSYVLDSTTSGYSSTIINNFSIDSCQYIGRLYSSTTDFLTHKGNCKYCQKRQEEMIERIVRKVLEEYKAKP